MYDSLNGGRTWTEDASFRPVGLCYSPWVDFNAIGDAFVSYNCFDQRISYRLRGQAAWVHTTISNAGEFPDRSTVMAGAPSGRVYIGYDDNRRTNAGYVLSSPNGQGSWTKSSRINDDGATIGVGVTVAPTSLDPPNDTVYAVWEDYPAGDIRMDVSSDGGRTWGADRLVLSYEMVTNGFFVPIPPQPHRGIVPMPSAAVAPSGGSHPGRLYVAYTDILEAPIDPREPLTDTNIYVVHSDDRGVTWSERKLVNDDGTLLAWQFHPAISVASNGTVVVSFSDTRRDFREEQADRFVSVSTDGGNTWSINERVTTQFSDESELTADANDHGDYQGLDVATTARFPQAWTDSRTGEEEVFASSDVPTGTQDISDTPDGVLGWDLGSLQTIDHQGLLVPTAGVCHGPEVPDPPGVTRDIQYADFQRLDNPNRRTPILLDEYLPGVAIPENRQWPALIIVHGGGFTSGCRGLMGGLAKQLSGIEPHPDVPRHFAVYAIDHRLACRGEDFPDSDQIAPLCDWPYTQIDPESGQKGAAAQDVRAAVAFVRGWLQGKNWDGDPEPDWDGRLMAIGVSAGGTPVLMAVATAPDAEHRPDVVATWSAKMDFADFLQVDPPVGESPWSCDHSAGKGGCWENGDKYLGCIDSFPPPPACALADLPDWHGASPAWQYPRPSDGGVPVLFSNAETELVPKLDADDFFARVLDFEGVQLYCLVAGGGHASGQLDKPCAEINGIPTGCAAIECPTVLRQTVDFLLNPETP